MKLKAVVIDDEPLARENIVNHIREVDFLELTGEGNNPVDLAELLNRNQVDLIFLDIQMPVMSGIDYLKMTPNPPMVIITTAYPSYALEGFQLDVMDYLLKPITFTRFFNAVQKARDYHQLLLKSELSESGEPGKGRSGNGDSRDGESKSGEDYFFIKCDYRFERIWFRDILFVESMQNYVTIHTVKGKYITLLPLKSVEQNLSDRLFIRVHKSFIVSIDKIETIENNEIVIQSTRIPISRQYKDGVINRVVNSKLWKK